MRKRALLLVLALSVAGCLDTGERGGPDVTTETTTTPTPSSPSPSPSTTTDDPAVTTSLYDCPYILSADPATEDQLNRTDRVRAYADLAPERQLEFDEALANGSVEMETLPEVWSGPRIITYEGKKYYTVAATC